MKIIRTSILSKITRTREIPIHEVDYIAWTQGVMIQDAAPYLSVDDREFILSGITPEEWNEEFKDDEAEAN